MKLKFAFIVLLSGVLLAQGQDSTHIHKRIRHDKFASGDIGLRYQIAYNGSLQSQFTVSGFVAKRIEIGGTFALNVSRISNTYQNTDSAGNNYQTTNNGWGYALGFDPFLIGHFPLKGKFDLYLGALGIFQISNTGTNNYTFYSPPATYFLSSENGIRNPVQLTLGGGYVLGCQYFFTGRLALGIQIGEWIGYTFAKRNAFYSSQNGTITNPPNITPLNFVATADFGAYAGITLSYYFSTKKKNYRIGG